MWLLKSLSVTPFGIVQGLPVIDGVEIYQHVKEARDKIDEEEHRLWPHVKPFPPWRDTHDELKAIYYQRVLAEGGATCTFTVNLSQDVLAVGSARTESFMKFVQERLARHLKHELKQPISYWFAIETSTAGRPHLHGAFRIDQHDLDVVREALQGVSRAGAGVPVPRAVVLAPVSDGPGWAGYAMKNLALTKKQLGAKVLSASAGIRHRAEQLYNLDYNAYRAAMKPHTYAGNPLWGIF